MIFFIVVATIIVTCIVACIIAPEIKKGKANKAWENASPEEKIIFKIIMVSYALLKNDKFSYLNKNNATLFDTSLFMLYIIIIKTCVNLNFTVTDEKSLQLAIWHIFFKDMFKKINDTYHADESIAESRMNFYDDIRISSQNSQEPNGINAVFNEYKNILCIDSSVGYLTDYNAESPLFISDSFTDKFFSDMEAGYPLNTALNDFDNEISSFINRIKNIFQTPITKNHR